MANSKCHKTVILDTGATSGAAPEEDKDVLRDTGEKSQKVFMFPDKRTSSGTKNNAQPLSSSTRDEYSARIAL